MSNGNKEITQKKKSQKQQPQQQQQRELPDQPIEDQEEQNNQQTWEIYKNALTFNVIAKYDPKINQFMHLTSYCVVYKYDDELNDWEKLDYQGPLVVYSRNHQEVDERSISVDEVLKNDRVYKYGLIVLNRSKPENFSIGLLSNKYLKKSDGEDDREIIVEKNEKLIIVRDFKGDTFGLWIFADEDRDYMCEILKFCIEN